MIPEDTQITMVNGMRKPVEFVHVGDEVITVEGGRATVYFTSSRFYTGQLYEIPVEDGFRGILVTEDQRIYVAGEGYLTADKIKDGMVLGDERWWGNRPAATPDLVVVGRVSKGDVKDLPVFGIEVKEDHSFFANGLAMGDNRKVK